MEAVGEITEAMNNVNINNSDSHKKNRIQVSNTKKPLFFYVNLAKVNPSISTLFSILWIYICWQIKLYLDIRAIWLT
jgi:hypothetical protein